METTEDLISLKTAILRIFDETSNDKIVINHFLLIFKLHVFKSREKKNYFRQSPIGYKKIQKN